MVELDAGRVGPWLEGKIGLSAALDLPIDDAALRRQAVALYQAGKWNECIHTLEAAMTAGDLGPYDAAILSRCFDEVDEPGMAEAWAKVANDVLQQIEAILSTGGGRR